MFYVADHNEDSTRKLVEFLQGSDFAGVIFSRVEIEGTFPLEAVRLNGTQAMPDVVISMRWTDDAVDGTAPGLIMADGGTRGKGMHGSLGRTDMHNTLVACGPDFRRGVIDEWPSGNVDLVPTVLWILGVAPSQPLDGRVLQEALAPRRAAPSTPETKTLEASRALGWYRWHQYLKVTQVGQTVYFDEGNGGPSR
jgi:arylsulfatase A-like enzyme